MESFSIEVVDSHTEGEPTRVVTSGFPELTGHSMAEKLECFRREYDELRKGLIEEPRGFPAIVGAVLTEPEKHESDAGVIFFNNSGYLGMCGHGTIGVAKTLVHLKKASAGDTLLFDTSAGTVKAEINPDWTVSVQNVLSYRFAKDVSVTVPGYGQTTGDIAWGGNWFFLEKERRHDLEIANLKALKEYSAALMNVLEQSGLTGAAGEQIDHIELFSHSEEYDAKNFVLCPGGEYDRSPCGTGTSAKIACLAEDGLLEEGEEWTQESITGGVFSATYRKSEGGVHPTITGAAYITSAATLFFDAADPFRFGIR